MQVVTEQSLKIMFENREWLEEESNKAIELYKKQPTLRNFNRLVDLYGRTHFLLKQFGEIM